MKYNVPFLRNKAFRENRTVGRDYVLIYLIKHILFPFIHIATFTTECFFFFFFLLATVIVAGGFISVKLNQTLGGKNNGRLQKQKTTSEGMKRGAS